MPWTCRFCTLLNGNDTFLACAACGSERRIDDEYYEDLIGLEEITLPKPPQQQQQLPPFIPTTPSPEHVRPKRQAPRISDRSTTTTTTTPQSKPAPPPPLSPLQGGPPPPTSDDTIHAKLPREARLQPILDELIETENVYVQEMETVVTAFLQPLRLLSQDEDDLIISNSDVTKIFSNIAELMRINTELKIEFDKIKKSTRPIDHRVEAAMKAFIRMSSHLKMYAFYAINYEASVNLLSRLEADNGKFRKWLAAVCEKEQCQPLSSFLIKPIQRICKYPLFFNTMMKELKEDDGGEEEDLLRDIVQKAYKAALLVAEQVNTEKARNEAIIRAIEVAERLEHLRDVVLEPSRRYVGEWRCLMSEGDSNLSKRKGSKAKNLLHGGSSKAEKKIRACILFTDVLLVLKEVGPVNSPKLKYLLRNWISMAQLEIQGINPEDSRASSAPSGGGGGGGGAGGDDDVADFTAAFKSKFKLPLDIIHVASTDREKLHAYRERQEGELHSHSAFAISRRASFVFAAKRSDSSGAAGNGRDTVITNHTMWFRSDAERRRVHALLRRTKDDWDKPIVASNASGQHQQPPPVTTAAPKVPTRQTRPPPDRPARITQLNLAAAQRMGSGGAGDEHVQSEPDSPQHGGTHNNNMAPPNPPTTPMQMFVANSTNGRKTAFTSRFDREGSTGGSVSSGNPFPYPIAVFRQDSLHSLGDDEGPVMEFRSSDLSSWLPQPVDNQRQHSNNGQGDGLAYRKNRPRPPAPPPPPPPPPSSFPVSTDMNKGIRPVAPTRAGNTTTTTTTDKATSSTPARRPPPPPAPKPINEDLLIAKWFGGE